MCFSRVETTGGIGNQRECIVNAILLARLLGLGLVVPVIHPIWHSHQDVLLNSHSGKQYEPPFANWSTWGQFDLVFDQDHFNTSSLAAGVRVVDRTPTGAYALIGVSALATGRCGAIVPQLTSAIMCRCRDRRYHAIAAGASQFERCGRRVCSQVERGREGPCVQTAIAQEIDRAAHCVRREVGETVLSFRKCAPLC
jgi:hypothetical protein